MVFIGIVTNSKSEEDIFNLLSNNKFLKDNNVIFIKESNIDNIKNVHFDTIVINSKFNKMDELTSLLANAKNILINMDEKIDFEDANVCNLNLITYGFNSKSSVTVSSVTDDDALICIQRNICSNTGVIEVQEIKIENDNSYNIYDLIIVVLMFLMYSSNLEEIHINSTK